jgi:hypothetical protein
MSDKVFESVRANPILARSIDKFARAFVVGAFKEYAEGCCCQSEVRHSYYGVLKEGLDPLPLSRNRHQSECELVSPPIVIPPRSSSKNLVNEIASFVPSLLPHGDLKESQVREARLRMYLGLPLEQFASFCELLLGRERSREQPAEVWIGNRMTLQALPQNAFGFLVPSLLEKHIAPQCPRVWIPRPPSRIPTGQSLGPLGISTAPILVQPSLNELRQITKPHQCPPRSADPGQSERDRAHGDDLRTPPSRGYAAPFAVTKGISGL